jgi:hypothetical protein
VETKGINGPVHGFQAIKAIASFSRVSGRPEVAAHLPSREDGDAWQQRHVVLERLIPAPRRWGIALP